jgi:hypothetical protein
MLSVRLTVVVCWCCYICGGFVDALMNVEERMARSRDLIKDLKPSEVALLQFDSRKLDNYWLTSAIWNDYYAKKHGHQFIYYSLTKGNRCGRRTTFSCVLSMF